MNCTICADTNVKDLYRCAHCYKDGLGKYPVCLKCIDSKNVPASCMVCSVQLNRDTSITTRNTNKHFEFIKLVASSLNEIKENATYETRIKTCISFFNMILDNRHMFSMNTELPIITEKVVYIRFGILYKAKQFKKILMSRPGKKTADERKLIHLCNETISSLRIGKFKGPILTPVSH